jgi:hypothetical protein
MKPSEIRAWERLTADMEGDMHQYDYWQDVAERIRQIYLDIILLEDAARAAGVEHAIIYVGDDDRGWGPHAKTGKHQYWRPLDDDGDALRLAVKLEIGMIQHQGWGQVMHPNLSERIDFKHEKDSIAATRRAIVRAAAALT